jgi:periplasmic copper chaperone A
MIKPLHDGLGAPNSYAAIMVIGVLLCLILVGCATPTTVLNAQVSEVWVRAAGSGITSAYMTIENPNSQALRLMTIETTAARVVEIHTMRVENEVMFMEPVTDGLEIAAGTTLDFAADDIHLMLIDLTDALEVGDTVQLTLTFTQSNAAPLVIPLNAPVLDAAPE